MATESKRQRRFSSVIHQDLAEILQREGNVWLPGVFVTITQVRMTPDLAIARVYLSFIDSQKAQDSLSIIRSKASDIRYKLGVRIKHDVRVVPHLEFFIDDTNEYVQHMDKIFDKISKEKRQSD